MVDLHCHILFGLDDGPKNIEDSLAMAEDAIADGITHVVATPHCSSQFLFDFANVRAARDALAEKLHARLKLATGCDFHLNHENLLAVRKHPVPFCINQKDYLLVEFNEFSIPPAMDQTLHELQLAGLRPIITHPERNPILRENLQRVVEWAEQGCVIQMTGSALTGFWGERTRHAAEWLLESQAVHVLATDAHDLEKRVPILSTSRDAAAQIVGDEVAEALVNDNPSAIVNDQPLPFFPRPSAISSYRKK